MNLYDRLYLAGATKTDLSLTSDEAADLDRTLRTYARVARQLAEMLRARDPSGSLKLKVYENTLANLDENTGLK